MLSFRKIANLLYPQHKSAGILDITNVECIEKDQSFARFETCILKSLNRTRKYFSK